MPRKFESGRVLLNSDAMKALEEMASALRETEKSIELNPSGFVSYIVTQFKKESFESKINELIRIFFNPKKYLKVIMSTLDSNHDVARVLASALDRIQTSKAGQKNRRATRVLSREEPSSPQDGIPT